MTIRPMHNHFYKLLLKNKFQYEDNLKYLAENKDNEIIFPVIFIINLFLIDFDTISQPEYTGDDLKKILLFIEAYNNDNGSNMNLSTEQALNIVSFAKLGRVSYELNKEIALMLAEFYNKSIDDDLFKYRLDILEDVCNLIEENH